MMKCDPRLFLTSADLRLAQGSRPDRYDARLVVDHMERKIFLLYRIDAAHPAGSAANGQAVPARARPRAPAPPQGSPSTAEEQNARPVEESARIGLKAASGEAISSLIQPARRFCVGHPNVRAVADKAGSRTVRHGDDGGFGTTAVTSAPAPRTDGFPGARGEQDAFSLKRRGCTGGLSHGEIQSATASIEAIR
jgi:hypothetical protein